MCPWMSADRDGLAYVLAYYAILDWLKSNAEPNRLRAEASAKRTLTQLYPRVQPPAILRPPAAHPTAPLASSTVAVARNQWIRNGYRNERVRQAT